MAIDVAISSCARVDILEKAIETFLEYVVSKDGFRLIICEDKVNDQERQVCGKNWIEEHRDLFSKIIYSEKKLTYVYCFSEIVKYLRTPYFFRLEDDVIFDEVIDVDELINFMKSYKDLAQIIFRRETHNLTNLEEINNRLERNIQSNPFYSIATGVFNLDWTHKILEQTEKGECHEAGVLTPIMKKLKAKSFVINGKEKIAALKCIGDDLGYKKGSWKK